MDPEHQHRLHRGGRADSPWLFTRMRARGWNIDIPRQFPRRCILMAAGVPAFLPAGIGVAGGRGMSRVLVAVLQLRAAERRRTAHLSRRLRDDRQARAEAVSGNHDGQVDARHRPGVAFCGRLFGHGARTERGHRAHDQSDLFNAFRGTRVGSLVVGVAIVVLIPFLRRLITDKAEIAPAERCADRSGTGDSCGVKER